MVRVKVEFWMWSPKELGPDFGSPTDRRATLNLCVADGTTVRALFEDLRHPMIQNEIFSDHAFHPDITLTLNSRVMGYDELYGRVLTDGDTIAVLPMYVGG